MHRKWAFLLLVVILTVGAVIRVHGLSEYKVYPDSYQSLGVAENIHTEGSVVAPMGEYGYLYPQFFGWTRPVYPLLINSTSALGLSQDTAARTVSFVAGILGILVAYLLVSTALRSREAGLFASALIALTYDHAVWGGFILTDTTGVLLAMLFLWLIYRTLAMEGERSIWHDALIGVVFACAVFTRYEYLVLALPLVYLYIHTKQPHTTLLLVTVGVSAFAVASMFLYALSPYTHDVTGILGQVSGLTDTVIPRGAGGLVGFLTGAPLLVVLYTVGMIYLLRTRSIRHHAIVSLLGIVPLAYMYYNTNPAMQRYFIHLLPFILIPFGHASLVLARYVKNLRTPLRITAYTAVALVLVWQGGVAYRGLHGQDENLWFTPGYEYRVAQEIAPLVAPGDLLIVSFPEPYYLATKNTTQSIADVPPFIYLSSEIGADRRVVVVEDEGMRHIFPQFTARLRALDNSCIVSELSVGGTYRYAQLVAPVQEPVRLYRCNLGDLQTHLDQTQ